MCVCVRRALTELFFYLLLIKVVEPYWLVTRKQTSKSIWQHVNIKSVHEMRSPKKTIVKLRDEKNLCLPELIQVTDDVKKKSETTAVFSRHVCRIQWTFKIIGVYGAACSLIRKHALLRNANIPWNSYLIEVPLIDRLSDNSYWMTHPNIESTIEKPVTFLRDWLLKQLHPDVAWGVWNLMSF